MTDFSGMKRRGEAVTLTDEQVDELIASDNGEWLHWFGLTAKVSHEGLARLRRAATEWKPQIAPRESKPV
jgi:hypothetical protein